LAFCCFPSDYSASIHLAASPPSLHSFPTRRSSDLDSALRAARRRLLRAPPRRQADDVDAGADAEFAVDAGEGRLDRLDADEQPRSEEHTSELQSRENLVCRLLLETKKSM